MKFLIALALVVVCVAASEINPDSEWASFKKQYSKVYEKNEDAVRRAIFEKNVKLVATHNAEAKNGKHSYILGMNRFGDMTNLEFTNQMNGYKSRPKTSAGQKFESKVKALPTTVDWRNQGIVTPVKNQEQCGSCWSFSAVASLEGQHALKTGNLTSLSEQNLIDCTRGILYNNRGCGGGEMVAAFRYVRNNNGIDTEASYPYEAKNDACRFNPNNVGATLTSYVEIQSGSETDLTAASATIGPISVAIDASHNSFQLYKGGVYNEPKCSKTELDHGVTVVGYGTASDGSNYYLVKNSWGADWGINGYIMMTRDGSNQCGIATSASYPIV